MKDKIISFILIFIIVAIIVVIGIFGYTIYVKIVGDIPIQINFEGYGDIFTSDTDKEETIDTNVEMFNGVEDKTTVMQTNIVNTKNYRHLYNQLNNTAKTIYDKLYTNTENLKTGTYKIEFGNTFYSLLSKDGGDEELKKQYQSAIEALIYENPEIFYLDATNMFLNIEKITKITGIKYNVYIDNGTKPNYLAEGFNNKQQIDEYVNQIEKVRDYILSHLKEKSDYEKIKLVHDYLRDSIEYDSTISKSNIYNIYGALVSRECVCEGYAKSFQYLMNAIEIDNTIVIGNATNSNGETENHAWNYIKLDNKWYAVDVTWDDPIVVGSGILSEDSKYKYFLKGAITMNQNHRTSGKFTSVGQTFKYPTLNTEDYKK